MLVSKKYGVNPSMQVCFWCGKDTGAIVLLGKLKGDAEAPRRIVTNYDPCDECKKGFAMGITVIEATTTPNHDGQRPMANETYPTGRLAVISRNCNHPFGEDKIVTVAPEVFSAMFSEEALRDAAKTEQPESNH